MPVLNIAIIGTTISNVQGVVFHNEKESESEWQILFDCI